MKRKGFSLVELMVVVAIIAILTAIALPMYSTFRRRSYAQNAVAPCNDAKKALQSWFQDNTSFEGLAIGAATGGPLTATAIDGNTYPVGIGLPEAQGLTWAVAGTAPAGGVATATITFTFTDAACLGCSGVFCIECDANRGTCEVEVDVDTTDAATNPLNSLDKNPGTVCP